MAAFVAHDWPGNVRELKNAAERSFYRWIAASETGPVDKVVVDAFAGGRLPETLHPGPASVHGAEAKLEKPLAPRRGYDLRARLDEIERNWVEEALIAHGWSQKRTADFLKLSYDQMRGLVRKHGLMKATASS
jgi:psp operon transcriptional activator